MNKYHLMLDKIMTAGKHQVNKKGGITYLLDQQMSMSPYDLLEIFEGHGIARKKLRSELSLFMQGERDIEKYREAGIYWWDYCGQILINSYPTYFAKLPALIDTINREKRNSKNYVLFLGQTGAETNQAPCLSLIQFQIDEGGARAVGISKKFGCNPWIAIGHIPSLSDSTTDRPSSQVNNTYIRERTHIRQ